MSDDQNLDQEEFIESQGAENEETAAIESPP